MQEPVFIQQNQAKWKQFEDLLLNSKTNLTPDQYADLYLRLTDDLSYAKTFYPDSRVVPYLNKLATQTHQLIYQNKKEKLSRFLTFWQYEVPTIFWTYRKNIAYSLAIFGAATAIGALSAAYDDTFLRLILGDSYVNMTIENIRNNDPMGVYKTGEATESFLRITLNNIRVSFTTFVFGVLGSIGTAWVLIQNGIMLGAFQYFFHQKGLLLTSVLSVWIHGTLEITAIVLAGAAGITMGNGLLFPGTYPRSYSFQRGATAGVKMIVGLIPIFIIAGFLEGFVTRQTELHSAIKAAIILASALFVLFYFVLYPKSLAHKSTIDTHENIL